MKRVVMRAAAKSGCASKDSRNGALVATPSMCSSRRARCALARASVKRGEALCTMSLASSESNDALVR